MSHWTTLAETKQFDAEKWNFRRDSSKSGTFVADKVVGSWFAWGIVQVLKKLDDWLQKIMDEICRRKMKRAELLGRMRLVDP